MIFYQIKAVSDRKKEKSRFTKETAFLQANKEN